MQARAPLMIEHRLIERLVTQIQGELNRIEAKKHTDALRIDTYVDFIKTYADRTHHGKEEDIYFKKLEEKSLSDDDRDLMNELIEDHRFGRKVTSELVEANKRYHGGDLSALTEIAAKLKALTDFYPRHIEKEDKIFFPAAQKYFSDAEQDELLTAFRDFDCTMIHEKYQKVVDIFEKG